MEQQNKPESFIRYSRNNLDHNKDAVVMYIDMNSFFASCEQQDNPELRGKPIGVITHPAANACVIAPSIEAKKIRSKNRYAPHRLP